MSMYIRVKRKNQIVRVPIHVFHVDKKFFLHCEPNETIGQVKEKINQIVNVETEQQRLLNEEKVILDDKATLMQHNIQNGEILYLLYKLNENVGKYQFFLMFDKNIRLGTNQHWTRRVKFFYLIKDFASCKKSL